MAESDPKVYRLLGWASLDSPGDNVNADASIETQERKIKGSTAKVLADKVNG
jgi:hypothetical protein